MNSLRAEKADIKLQGAGDIDVKLDKAGTVNSTLYGEEQLNWREL